MKGRTNQAREKSEERCATIWARKARKKEGQDREEEAKKEGEGEKRNGKG